MTHAPAPDEANRTATYASRPPMPSIAASALMESRMFLALTRRAIAGFLTRG